MAISNIFVHKPYAIAAALAKGRISRKPEK